MRGINKVTLIGHLGKDPEIRHFDSGAIKASFSLATTESYINKEGQKVDQTEWHNIVMWRGLAGVAEKYLKKGNPVYIEGKLRYRSWDDENGQKRYITEIDAQNMIMLGGAPSGAGTGNQQPKVAQDTSHLNISKDDAPKVEAKTNTAETDNGVPFDDDLPF